MSGPWEQYAAPAEDGPWAQYAPEKSFASKYRQGVGNLAAGAVRGAGSIGATMLAPLDIAKDAIAGKGLSLESNRARRQAMDDGLRSMGADTDSAMYGVGKLGGEIAGTLGVGGTLARGVGAVAPRATGIINSLASGGFRTGAAPGAANMLTRTAGGAVTGGASAGLVDPEYATTGALIGGALPGGVKVAKAVGSGINKVATGTVKNVLGMATGTGGNSVSTAYRSGREGATSFVDNMRGKVPFDDVLGSAKTALGKMRLDRSAQYKSGMVDISNDKSIIQFQPIDDAMRKISNMGSYKGQQINKNAAGTVDDLRATIDNWRSLDPAEYHSPEGLDALKRAIGDIRDVTNFGTPARRAADEVYNAVKNQITAQAPTYSKVMKDYDQASKVLSEIERALSLGKQASVDTSMRKLQSLMRNNVNTNYGNRLGLATTLEQSGADILPAVAGQSMSSWTPRGMAGLAASGGAIGSMLTNPAALTALPLTSPRIVGELAYGAGKASRGMAATGTAANSRLAQMLGGSNATPITMNKLAPWLATGAVVSASQK
jgi:hypothetical protein